MLFELGYYEEEDFGSDEEFIEEDEEFIDEDEEGFAEEEPNIEWSPEGEGEGELVVTVPAIPERNVPVTKLRARGTKRSASASVAKQASKILNSKLAQSVMPPQAKLALSAARGLAKVIPSQWKKAGVKAAKQAGKKVLKKLKFW